MPGVLPGPRLLPLVGLPIALGVDLLGFVSRVAAAHGGLASLGRLGRTPIILVTEPELVGEILQGRWRDFVRDEVVRESGAPVFGRGLLLADGPLWLRLRQTMQPAFRRERMQRMVELIHAEVERHLDRFEALADRGQPLRVADSMARLTQEVFVRAMFTTSLASDLDRLLGAWTVINEYVAGRLIAPVRIPPHWPTPGNRRLRRAMAVLEQIVRPILVERRAAAARGETTDDMLGLLLAARDPDSGEGLDDDLLYEQILMTFFAGFETTASALTNLWMLLAAHPEVEQRLHAELDATLDGHAPSSEQLAALPWLRMVIDETLRLYPSAFMIARQCEGPQQLAGHTLAAGTVAFISTWVMHRDPQRWPQPERFDPTRFGPDAPPRGRFDYIPFGAGPRLCIGKQLALMEAQLIVAGIARRYRLRELPGTRHRVQPLFTLHVRGGAPMLIERRR
jgi:cytochrome P450